MFSLNSKNEITAQNQEQGKEIFYLKYIGVSELRGDFQLYIEITKNALKKETQDTFELVKRQWVNIPLDKEDKKVSKLQQISFELYIKSICKGFNLHFDEEFDNILDFTRFFCDKMQEYINSELEVLLIPAVTWSNTAKKWILKVPKPDAKYQKIYTELPKTFDITQDFIKLVSNENFELKISDKAKELLEAMYKHNTEINNKSDYSANDTNNNLDEQEYLDDLPF